MEQLKDHISTLTISNTVKIVELVDSFWAFNSKERKFTYCSSSSRLKCEEQIDLLWPRNSCNSYRILLVLQL